MGQKAADQLRQILVPDLLTLVGDPKTHLVTAELVQQYLRLHQLIFDDTSLRSMFAEADFKKENGLSLGSLVAAIQGRSGPLPGSAIWPGQASTGLMLLPLQVSKATVRPKRVAESGVNHPQAACGRTAKSAGPAQEVRFTAVATCLLESCSVFCCSDVYIVRITREVGKAVLILCDRQAGEEGDHMDTSQTAAPHAASVKPKRAAFTTKPMTGEWGSLVRAASQSQASATGAHSLQPCFSHACLLRLRN